MSFTMKSAMGAGLDDLSRSTVFENAALDVDCARFRDGLAERRRLFGVDGCRTPEQAAAWDAFVAGSKVECREICEDGSEEDYLIELFVREHGCIGSFGFNYPDVDWEHIRGLAIERGYNV